MTGKAAETAAMFETVARSARRAGKFRLAVESVVTSAMLGRRAALVCVDHEEAARAIDMITDRYPGVTAVVVPTDSAYVFVRVSVDGGGRMRGDDRR